MEAVLILTSAEYELSGEEQRTLQRKVKEKRKNY